MTETFLDHMGLMCTLVHWLAILNFNAEWVVMSFFVCALGLVYTEGYALFLRTASKFGRSGS